ncbi:hypothetical protein ILFOPFJJ_06156 [Ensifer psoraleae]|nr:hypothetical protein [Sinorhizobium sp. 7-81]NRP75233.1 hypothetical protein [Sinorhizobium psoraleae]
MDFERQLRDDEREPDQLGKEEKTFDPWEDHFRREYRHSSREFEY